jgi:hypothetical protein
MPIIPTRKCPLPIPTRQSARALIRIHCRLRGEIEKANGDVKPLVPRREALATMRHIEAMLQFLGINFDQSALRPTWTVPKIRHLEHGGMRRGILDALRHGDWLTYREIGKMIVAERRLKLTSKQFHDFLQKLREAMFAMKQRGIVTFKDKLRFGDYQAIQRVRLSQAMLNR